MPKSTWLAISISLGTVACLPPAVQLGFHLTSHTPTYTAFPAVNGSPSDWTDATKDLASVPAWLYPGNWYLIPSLAGFAGGVYHQEEVGNFPHFTIRRYAGTVFGSNGNLPAHYKVSLAVQPFDMPSWQPPVGENGILVYYRNPTNYVELVVSNTNVAVWSANNAAPTGGSGWTGHYWYGLNTKPGDIRRLAAEIDTDSQQLTYWVEGQKAATLHVPMLTGSVPHGVALRSIGNRINFGEVKIEALSSVPQATPSPTPTVTALPSPTPTATSSPTKGFQAYGQLPVAMVWQRAAAVGNLLYVSGGSNGSSSFNTVYSSPVQSPWSWTSRTALPQPTEGHGFVVVGSYAYVIGGWGRGSSPRANVYRALIGANGSLGNWQAMTPLPSARAFAAVVAKGSQIVVMGGWNAGYGSTNTVFTSSVNADGSLAPWQQAPNLPANRVWGAACAPTGKLIFTGGSSGGTQATVFEAPWSNGQIGPWQTIAPLPQPLEGHVCELVNGLPTTFGGDFHANGVIVPSQQIHQLSNGTWKSVGTLPAPRFGQASASVGGLFYLMGGHDSFHNVLAAIWRGLP